MGFKLSTEVRDGYIYGVTTGEIRTANDVLEKLANLRRVADEKGIFRVLMEERTLLLHIDAHDSAVAANMMENEGLQHIGGRMACLYNPECEGAFRMLETLYLNRSLSYRLFRDEAEALAWLMR